MYMLGVCVGVGVGVGVSVGVYSIAPQSIHNAVYISAYMHGNCMVHTQEY